MPEISEILHGVRPEVDFAASRNFISDGILDSLDIVTLVSEMEKAYGIRISGLDIVPENFRNITAIQNLLNKYGRT